MKGLKGFHIGHKHSLETKIKIGNALRRPIEFNCNYCLKLNIAKPSAYRKQKRHFCNQICYANFVKEKIPFNERNAYRGVRKINESKQVYHRRYCKKNPNIISHHKSLRYARERGAEGSHTLMEWEQLKDKFNQKCANCFKEKKLTKDHIIPLSQKGTNFIINIQPLCKNCNSKKWKFNI